MPLALSYRSAVSCAADAIGVEESGGACSNCGGMQHCKAGDENEWPIAASRVFTEMIRPFCC